MVAQALITTQHIASSGRIFDASSDWFGATELLGVLLAACVFVNPVRRAEMIPLLWSRYSLLLGLCDTSGPDAFTARNKKSLFVYPDIFACTFDECMLCISQKSECHCHVQKKDVRALRDGSGSGHLIHQVGSGCNRRCCNRRCWVASVLGACNCLCYWL